MKKAILVIMLMISSLAFCQESILIKKEDFKLESDNRWRVKSKVFNLTNGNNKPDEAIITISCSEDIYSSIDLNKINKIILFSNERSKELVKNKYTYVTKVIKLSSMPNTNQWHLTIEYVAQNEYGATKDGLNSGNFNENGEVISFSNLL
jgi:hypothetical protein